jgi:hypothetical protein
MLGQLSDILPKARQGQIARSGRSQSGIDFEVHGAGCLMVDQSGREVDLDFMPDGTVVFDAWRVNRFLGSLGCGGQDQGKILDACRRMVRESILREPRPEWFAWIDSA